MSLRPHAKRYILDVLPPAMSAYLRKERQVWGRQLKQNKRTLSAAIRSRAFTKALLAPVEPKTVVWESFSGNGALCNPEALFRQMVDDPKYSEYQHIWVLQANDRSTRFRAEFGEHRRVRIVRYRSRAYFKALESSEYLVNNATFPADFVKRPEQTYLNTWHGTPLKKMGYDMPDGADGARNIIRNFMSADYLLSQNAFMTEQMYLRAYKLANIYSGAIIEEGYPRTDLMSDPKAGERARQTLASLGVRTAGRKVLVYAPTWRGESFYKPNADVSRLKSTLRELRGQLGDSGWTVLLKAHQVVFDQLVDDPELNDFLIPNEIPANDVLGLADALVSDYSSIFVDYLSTGRPLFFHVSDGESYAESRGLYFDESQLPGPISRTVSELCRHVSVLADRGAFQREFTDEHARAVAMAADLTPDDDGQASARIIDIVFGENEDDYRIRRGFSDDRKKLVIYLGGMITNGITSAALNLLNHLDPSVYDVTAFYYRSRQRDRVDNAQLIPGHVRQVIRDPGSLQLPLLGSMHNLDAVSAGEVRADDDSALWSWEWRRIFGESEFDAAVDFSGYSSYWTRIMAHSASARRAIWLHNDLEADALREVNGKLPHLQNLTGVFKLYPAFDALVSVSPDLNEINRSNLSQYSSVEHFVSARNLINVERIRAGGGRSKTEAIDAGTQDMGDLSAVIHRLGEIYSLTDVIDEASRQQLVTNFIGMNTGKSFVTVGRLSPEKNHARLLSAFGQVVEGEPDAKLVIIGEGPLEMELRQQAVSLGIAGCVEFTGRLRNPYAVMSACDCFVMSSDYEGQPIVILEARVLGLPIISTRFGSVDSAMEGSGGLVVERNDDALAEGMRAFLAGDVTSTHFDAEGYNADVLAEFEHAVFGS
ncbi:MAG: CDP-glycerol glycerophosphotransferase family protein [Brevibacterium sp.]